MHLHNSGQTPSVFETLLFLIRFQVRRFHCPPSPSLKPLKTRTRSQEAVGPFTKRSATRIVGNHNESQPDSHTRHASTRDPKTGEELAQVRTTPHPWTGRCSVVVTSELIFFFLDPEEHL